MDVNHGSELSSPVRFYYLGLVDPLLEAPRLWELRKPTTVIGVMPGKRVDIVVPWEDMGLPNYGAGERRAIGFDKWRMYEPENVEDEDAMLFSVHMNASSPPAGERVVDGTGAWLVTTTVGDLHRRIVVSGGDRDATQDSQSLMIYWRCSGGQPKHTLRFFLATTQSCVNLSGTSSSAMDACFGGIPYQPFLHILPGIISKLGLEHLLDSLSQASHWLQGTLMRNVKIRHLKIGASIDDLRACRLAFPEALETMELLDDVAEDVALQEHIIAASKTLLADAVNLKKLTVPVVPMMGNFEIGPCLNTFAVKTKMPMEVLAFGRIFPTHIKKVLMLHLGGSLTYFPAVEENIIEVFPGLEDLQVFPTPSSDFWLNWSDSDLANLKSLTTTISPWQRPPPLDRFSNLHSLSVTTLDMSMLQVQDFLHRFQLGTVQKLVFGVESTIEDISVLETLFESLGQFTPGVEELEITWLYPSFSFGPLSRFLQTPINECLTLALGYLHNLKRIKISNGQASALQVVPILEALPARVEAVMIGIVTEDDRDQLAAAVSQFVPNAPNGVVTTQWKKLPNRGVVVTYRRSPDLPTPTFFDWDASFVELHRLLPGH